MLKVLAFTKDRPLQFEAYLSSLLTLSDIQPEQISVILPSCGEYTQTISDERFEGVNWIEESRHGGFDKTFRKWIKELGEDDLVLFGCDDCVFIRPFVTKPIEEYMLLSPESIGFSLRLGQNIEGCPIDGYSGMIAEYRWEVATSHWSWCFELMSTVYRADLAKEIADTCKQEIKCPNFYESHGVIYCTQYKPNLLPYMGMFNSDSYLVAFDVNRVQDYFENKIQSSQDLNVEHLKDIYNQGRRLYWQNAFNISPKDIFVGDQYWKVI